MEHGNARHKIELPTNASELSPDRPLSDARADALGHAAFASHLARTIAQLAPRAGIAIALHGDPGAGRSSMLNLVRHALREQPQSSKWTIVEWNPWLLTGNDDLERRFVHLLATATLPSSPAGDPPPDDSQVAALRARVASTFSSGDKRLVVVIDDVDRLPAGRAAEVLRLLASVASVPNLIFLVAVGRTLPDAESVEKAFQVVIDLPLPERSSLQQMFLDRLDPVLVDARAGGLLHPD
ncbi:MAG: hypothetical protein QOE17_909, partial [Gaiellales bacterium]|nr:hypothetical protein [Gaiellales bacterium]